MRRPQIAVLRTGLMEKRRRIVSKKGVQGEGRHLLPRQEFSRVFVQQLFHGGILYQTIEAVEGIAGHFLDWTLEGGDAPPPFVGFQLVEDDDFHAIRGAGFLRFLQIPGRREDAVADESGGPCGGILFLQLMKEFSSGILRGEHSKEAGLLCILSFQQVSQPQTAFDVDAEGVGRVAPMGEKNSPMPLAQEGARGECGMGTIINQKRRGELGGFIAPDGHHWNTPGEERDHVGGEGGSVKNEARQS